MRQFIGLLWLLRPPIVLVLALTALAGQRAGYPHQGVEIADLTPLVPLMLVASSAAIDNDVRDAAIDAVNTPYRPIPSGAVGLELARSAQSILLVIAAYMAGVCTSLAQSAYLLVMYATLLVYDTRFVRRSWFMKNLTPSLIFGTACFYLLDHEAEVTRSFVFAALVGVFMLGREMLMDVRDTAGDDTILRRSLSPQVGTWAGVILMSSALVLLDFCFLPGIAAPSVQLVTAVVVTATARRRPTLWIVSEAGKLMLGLTLLLLIIMPNPDPLV